MSLTLSNLPAPDELAAVRAQIKALQAREAELRTLLLTEPTERVGTAYVAVIKTTERPQLDSKELRRCHPDLVAEFTFPQNVTTISLLALTEDGELLSPRALRHEEVNTNGQ